MYTVPCTACCTPFSHPTMQRLGRWEPSRLLDGAAVQKQSIEAIRKKKPTTRQLQVRKGCDLKEQTKAFGST